MGGVFSVKKTAVILFRRRKKGAIWRLVNLCLSFHDSMGGGFSVKKQQNLEIISFHFMIIWDFYGSSAKKNPTLEYRTQPTNFSRNKQQNAMGFLANVPGRTFCCTAGSWRAAPICWPFSWAKSCFSGNFFGAGQQKSRGQNEVFGSNNIYTNLGQNPK